MGWIKLHEWAMGERYIAVDFEAQPDFAAVAEACGCWGLRVERPGDIRPALGEALRQNLSGVPAVLDFIVDPWDFPDGFKEFHSDIWPGFKLGVSGRSCSVPHFPSQLSHQPWISLIVDGRSLAAC